MNELILKVQNYFSRTLFSETPVILIDEDSILHSLSFFSSTLNLSTDAIYYPLKVNTTREVLQVLNKQGVCFEIASLGELEILKNLKIKPGRIVFGNPIKRKVDIIEASKYGVNMFACDSIEELKKIASCTSKSSIYIRLAITNNDAQWSLDSKFGLPEKEIYDFFNLALELGVHIAGLSFHVGWNNTGIQDWLSAMQMCQRIVGALSSNGISLSFVNIGGGFPAHRVNQYDALTRLSGTLNPFIDGFKRIGIDVYAEPGSFLLANAGVMICQIVEVIIRDGQRWVYIDTGVMQGFAWIHAGLIYDIFTLDNYDSKEEPCVVTGITCDSHDIFGKHVLLPTTIKTGDRLLISPAGAYISASKKYNGIDFPREILYKPLQ